MEVILDNEVFQIGNMIINCGEHLLTANGSEVRLDRVEFEVLCLLAANAGQIVRITDILHAIWGPDYLEENWYVHNAISSMRKKLSTAAPEVRNRIVNVYGMGYVLRPDDVPEKL